MSNGIKRHRPGCVDAGEAEFVNFETLAELLEIPWVKGFSKDCKFVRFYQVVTSAMGKTRTSLMAAYSNGTFWCCGFLNHPVDGLPIE